MDTSNATAIRPARAAMRPGPLHTIAHDLNNALTEISGYADLLLMDMGQDEPGSADVMEIQDAVRRAVELTAELLTLANTGGS